MDSKILTMFEIVFDDIDPKLNLTVMCRNKDQLSIIISIIICRYLIKSRA